MRWLLWCFFLLAESYETIYHFFCVLFNLLAANQMIEVSFSRCHCQTIRDNWLVQHIRWESRKFLEVSLQIARYRSSVVKQTELNWLAIACGQPIRMHQKNSSISMSRVISGGYLIAGISTWTLDSFRDKNETVRLANNNLWSSYCFGKGPEQAIANRNILK